METHWNQSHVDRSTTTPQETTPAETPPPRTNESGIAEFLQRDDVETAVSREEQEKSGAQPLAPAAPRTTPASKDGPSWLNVRVAGYEPGKSKEAESKEERRQQPRAGSSAAQTAKLDPNAPEFSTYLSDMARNIEGKAAFFRREIDGLGPEPKTVLDFGTCGAELPETLSKEFPQHRFSGLDLSPQMLASGLRRMEERGIGRPPGLVAADGFRPPLKNEAVDAVTMSSFFHELFSYSSKPHTVEGLKPAMQEVHRILKDGGRVIIRDPAKPENPDEPVLVKAFDHNGKNPATQEELIATHPGELSTRALLSRFTHEFAPARRIFPDGKPAFDQDGRVEMPAWLASEFIRHRTLVDTPDHWNAEMKEQYGVFTPAEMREFAEELGFDLVEARTSYNPNNHAAGYEGEMLVTDREGRPFEQSERFPTQITAVLRKPTAEERRERAVDRQVENREDREG